MSQPTHRPLEGRMPDPLEGDGPLAIRSITDALELAGSMADLLPPSACAVRLGDDGQLLDIVRLDDDPTDVVEVADAVLHDSFARGDVGAVFLVSIGVDVAPGLVDEELADEWFRLDDVFDEAGIELLDWLLVGDQHVRSMARSMGVGGRW